MPLFTRPDGTPVPDLDPVRRMIPYLMPGRNESVVYYEQLLDLSATQPFIEAWNRREQPKLTVFHLILAGMGRVVAARPGLNRFVSGGRIYQRHHIDLSFAAKQAFADRAPLRTVKFRAEPAEPLLDTVRRLHEIVGEARGGTPRAVDTELRILLRLPGPALRLVMRLARLADRFNLLPAGLIASDPMYASVFVANLGSVGIDRAWHHLYEYGTVSVFCVVGRVGDQVVPGPDGAPVVRPGVRLRYAFDERINDGFYCASSLDMLRDYVERPELLLASPGERARADE